MGNTFEGLTAPKRTRAALTHFRRQGQGTLINLASVWSQVTTPDVSPYVTSKFAIRAFSECLRQELADTPDITVATMLPQAVDTPIFANAAVYAGRRPLSIPSMLDPREVAHGIIRGAETPAREVTYRRLGRLIELWHSLLPRLYERTVPAAFAAGNYASEMASGCHDGQPRNRRRVAQASPTGAAQGTSRLSSGRCTRTAWS